MHLQIDLIVVEFFNRQFLSGYSVSN